MHRCMAAVLLVLSWKAVAQENWQKAKMSDAQLTTEQIAVYRAVLREYLKGSERTLNLASVTEPIDSSDKTCFKGMDARDIKESASVIHRIESLVAADSNIVLVDPGRQQTPIKENDPQNLIRNAIHDGQKVTDEQLEQAVKSAFDSGLSELSEIVFDKGHRRAVVAYSFVCGELCGSGDKLVLKKIGSDWRVAKRCGGWVS